MWRPPASVPRARHGPVSLHKKTPCLREKRGWFTPADLLRGRTSRVGNREWISWLRSNATKSRGRWLSPSQGIHPSGDTRTFFSFTVAGPRRIHTGFPISRWLFSFQNGANPSEADDACQGRPRAGLGHIPVSIFCASCPRSAKARILFRHVGDCARTRHGQTLAKTFHTRGSCTRHCPCFARG
jgi:hypothetical protein